ncbi:MAG TPA: rhodanese-like domain-containing protein [Mycobacterium sp.]|nr:rhodanese-like domain-containing protein [Mycobacterium sp.]
MADFEALAKVGGRDGLRVVDVRREDEFSAEHISGAVNIPVHTLLDRLDDLGDREIWVHCASGYRASVAASLLDGACKNVVLLDDTFDSAVELGLTG